MTTKFDKPTTAIIGAGISGLTASKMLDDYGVPHTCFEMSDRIGGNWAFGNPNGMSSAYKSLHIDTSKYQLSFRDFPMPESYPDFPHHTLVKEYLEDYAEAFDLKKNIEFSNGVRSARRKPGGGWELDLQDGSRREFDFLVVGNGHHWDARLPEFDGEFTGESFHSHLYIDPEQPLHLRGKRILVVGIGNSAADIAVELSSRTLDNEVVISTRSSAWIVPKYIRGKPADMGFKTSPHIPLKWQRKVISKVAPMQNGYPSDMGLPEPNHKFMEAHPTQSVELPLRLGSGDLTAKGNLKRLDGKTVHFEDGTSADFDVIIYATGYNITFPFFDPEFFSAKGNHISLYKRMFSPGIDDLAFIGFAQSTPTLFPFVEAQTRILGAYLVGQYALPSVEEMKRVIAEDEALYLGHMLPTARHTQQLDYFVYEHQLRTKELPTGRARVCR